MRSHQYRSSDLLRSTCRSTLIYMLRARAHYVKFGLTRWRIIFCVSRRPNTPVFRSWIKRSFPGQGVSYEISRWWVISPQSCSHNVAKATTAWWTPRLIEEQVQPGLFFFFSTPQCNCWSGPMNLRRKFSNSGPKVNRWQPTTWCWRQRNFMFDKLPRWLSTGR